MSKEMKDSDIEWIGEIPKEWKVRKYKNFCEVYAGGTPDTSKNEYYDGDIPWIQSGKVQNCEIFQCSRYITQDGLNSSSTKIIPKETSVLAMTGATCGNVGYLKIDSCANQSVMAFVTKNGMSDKFIYYSLMTQKEAILLKQNGSAQSGINVEIGKNLAVAYPNLQHQYQIAAYLDTKVSQIDTIIQKQTQLIEEYKAYKQSLITETVTKGLNPNVEMKDSGVEWIGMIPEHWQVRKIKYLLSERKQKSITGLEEPLSMSQKYGLIKTCDMDNIPNMAQSTIGNKNVKIGDLVFNKLKAHLGVFAVSQYEGIVSPDYAVYIGNNNVNTKYLEYLFKTDVYICQFKRYSKGVGEGLTRLYTEDLFNIKGAFPNRVEQDEIVTYLENKFIYIDKLITQKQSLIQQLEVYQKSLIYECVTGKREIPSVHEVETAVEQVAATQEQG